MKYSSFLAEAAGNSLPELTLAGQDGRVGVEYPVDSLAFARTRLIPSTLNPRPEPVEEL